MTLSDIEVSTFLLALVTVLLLGYIFCTRNHGIFKEMGLRGPKPLPFFGTFITLRKKGIFQFCLDLPKKYGKNVGCFDGPRPVLYTSDVSVIKQITIKQWHNFINRRDFRIMHSYAARTMLFFNQDGDWKRLRSLLSPAFSSGKLKKMTPLIQQCGTNLADNMAQVAKDDTVIDPKELFGCFTMDVIASTSFGIDLNSSKDKDSKFLYYVKRMLMLDRLEFLVIIIVLFPWLGSVAAFFGTTMFPKDSLEFFMQVVRQAIEVRQKEGFSRVDFLKLMMEAHKLETEREEDQLEETEENPDVTIATKQCASPQKKGMTEEEILGNSVLFFIAGYETTASTLNFLSYLLATHQDAQDKLLQEVDSVVGKRPPTYEDLPKLQYLEMCFNETLRLYPIVPRTERVCKTATIVDGMNIPKDMMIGINVAAVHRDPEYYPDPEKFDPKRFSPEEKAKRDPLTFMPFGSGPRNCIGMRLAYMEAKLAMAYVMQRVKFVTCEQTQIPLKLEKIGLLMPETPLQLKLQLR